MTCLQIVKRKKFHKNSWCNGNGNGKGKGNGNGYGNINGYGNGYINGNGKDNNNIVKVKIPNAEFFHSAPGKRLVKSSSQPHFFFVYMPESLAITFYMEYVEKKEMTV